MSTTGPLVGLFLFRSSFVLSFLFFLIFLGLYTDSVLNRGCNHLAHPPLPYLFSPFDPLTFSWDLSSSAYPKSLSSSKLPFEQHILLHIHDWMPLYALVHLRIPLLWGRTSYVVCSG